MSDGATEMKREEFKVGDRVYIKPWKEFGSVVGQDGCYTKVQCDGMSQISYWSEKSLEKLNDDWNEERQDIIGQNGNDGSHYGVSIDEATPQDWDSLKTPVSQPISDACDKIKKLLLEKNRKYGNSALSPKRIFSKSCATEQLKVRIDDKLSRIANTGLDGADEDTLQDLIGYLILLMVARDA
jgi:hypothetical protein